MYTYDSEGYFKLTYPYTEAELPMLLRAVDQLKLGNIAYKVIVLSNGSRELWRKKNSTVIHPEFAQEV